MKASNLVGLASTIAISLMLVFSAAYSYNEVYGSGVSVVVGAASVNYSFSGINVSAEANLSNSGLIPVSVSVIGKSAQLLAGEITHLLVQDTINFSSLYQLGFPFSSIQIPMNLTGSLSSMVFQKSIILDLGKLLIQRPFENLFLNETNGSNGQTILSGITHYLWNFAFNSVTAYILNNGRRMGNLTISKYSGNEYSITGSATLTGSHFVLEVGNLSFPLTTNVQGQLIMASS